MNNRTIRYHLLLGKRDWEPLIQGDQADRLSWEPLTNSVRLASRLFFFPPHRGDTLLSPPLRRGAAFDSFGNCYWVGPDNNAIFFSGKGDSRKRLFWSPTLAETAATCTDTAIFRDSDKGVVPSVHFSSLCVTTAHYLVAASSEPAGLWIFDLPGGGMPAFLPWEKSNSFHPLDMSPAPDEGLVILDRHPDNGESTPLVWFLNGRFHCTGFHDEDVPVASPEGYFHAQGATCTTPGRKTFPLGIPLVIPGDAGHCNPVSIECLPDNSIFLLDNRPGEHFSRIHRFQGDRYCHSVSLEHILRDNLADTHAHEGHVAGHDFCFVGMKNRRDVSPLGTLYVADTGGNQSFAFSVIDRHPEFDLMLQPRYYPMRRFTGKALAVSKGDVFYDIDDRWITLTAQNRSLFETSAVFESPVFDGREFQCRWHRCICDAMVPAETSLIISSRSADDKNILSTTDWYDEPVPYQRGSGSEIPYSRPFTGECADQPYAGSWETLFQKATGRYLQLRFTLTGDGRATPRIRACRIYYPRLSYLDRYLPALYRDDIESASFLDRFLSNIEGMVTGLESSIADVQKLFDAHTCPPEYLDWLAGWLGVMLDGSWEPLRKRLFLRHAMELFRQRGTIPGLIRALRLAVDPRPDDTLFSEPVTGCEQELWGKKATSKNIFGIRVIEKFRLRQGSSAVVGDPTTTSYTTSSEWFWTIELGTEMLHRKFRDYLLDLYSSIDALNKAWDSDYSTIEEIKLVPIPPGNHAIRHDWERFVQSIPGLSYVIPEKEDVASFRLFLADTYTSIDTLNDAYMLLGDEGYNGFDDISFPLEFPENEAALRDWIHFVSIVLPTIRHAHSFIVLVPTVIDENGQRISPNLKLIADILRKEKPAHTCFELREYWALFRVGKARLGIDSLLDKGSRLYPLVCNQAQLGRTHLYFPWPWNDTHARTLVGKKIGISESCTQTEKTQPSHTSCYPIS